MKRLSVALFLVILLACGCGGGGSGGGDTFDRDVALIGTWELIALEILQVDTGAIVATEADLPGITGRLIVTAETIDRHVSWADREAFQIGYWDLEWTSPTEGTLYLTDVDTGRSGTVRLRMDSSDRATFEIADDTALWGAVIRSEHWHRL